MRGELGLQGFSNMSEGHNDISTGFKARCKSKDESWTKLRMGIWGISPDSCPWRKGELRTLGSLLMSMMGIKGLRRNVS